MCVDRPSREVLAAVLALGTCRMRDGYLSHPQESSPGVKSVKHLVIDTKYCCFLLILIKFYINASLFG